MKIQHKIAVFCVALTILTACKKYTEVSPPLTSPTGATVFSSDATAIAVLTGVYDTNLDLSLQLSEYCGLSADEFTLYTGNFDPALDAFYKNSLLSTPSFSPSDMFWIRFYSGLFTVNSAIQGLQSATSLTPAVQQQLIGEAKFMRAFFYFELVNLYGDVPLALSTDYTINSRLARSDKKNVYQQIISDLTDAKSLLSSNYLSGTLLSRSSERERPTVWAADALLARVYLYYANVTSDPANYKQAEEQASLLLDNNSQFNLSALNSVFLKYSLGNNETIWSLQPTNSFVTNTWDALTFVIDPTVGPSSSYPVYLSDDLVNSFEPNDQRKSSWLANLSYNGSVYYSPYKYKVSTYSAAGREYQMLFRLGEQYLIRAEARAQQGNISGAQSDLNKIRLRAGLSNTTAADKTQLLTAILRERRVELFSELGQRWFDLKRTGNIDAVMNAAAIRKGSSWKSTQQLYPIPFTDIQRDNNLVPNPGY